jgi:hypothetical protein
MRRRLPNILTAVSLALWTATVVLWVRSHWAMDVLQWRDDWVLGQSKAGTSHVLWSSRGHLGWAVVKWSFRMVPAGRSPVGEPIPSGPPWARSPESGLRWASVAAGYDLNRIVFPMYPNGIPDVHSVRPARVSFIVPAVLFAVWPSVMFGARVLRRLAGVPGTCARCGYDLRATPERCPECGTVPDRDVG